MFPVRVNVPVSDRIFRRCSWLGDKPAPGSPPVISTLPLFNSVFACVTPSRNLSGSSPRAVKICINGPMSKGCGGTPSSGDDRWSGYVEARARVNQVTCIPPPSASHKK